MAYPSATADTFLSQVADWIVERGEVLALIRHSHMAGAKDFEFFRTFDAFRDRLARLAPRTCITVFGSPQLSLRGRVDDELLKQAMAIVPDREEFLMVGIELVHYGRASWYPYDAEESHSELRELLEEWRGQLAAFGPYPRWLEDGTDVASAVVPQPDGTVETGVY